MRWYLQALRHYADFNGRARRTECLTFFLINFVILLLLQCVMRLSEDLVVVIVAVAVSLLFFLAILIPSISAAVRRLHDQGKSGVWCFLIFVPLLGFIWMFTLLFADGTYGPNSYGEDPRRERKAAPKVKYADLQAEEMESQLGEPAEEKPGVKPDEVQAKYATVTDLTLSMDEADMGDEVFAEIAYEIAAGESGEFLIALSVNGFDVGCRKVSAPPSFQGTVVMPVPFTSPGRYYVMAGGRLQTLVVS